MTIRISYTNKGELTSSSSPPSPPQSPPQQQQQQPSTITTTQLHFNTPSEYASRYAIEPVHILQHT